MSQSVFHSRYRVIDKDVRPGSEAAFAAGHVLGRERDGVDTRGLDGEDPSVWVHGAGRGVDVTPVVGDGGSAGKARRAVAVKHLGARHPGENLRESG